LFEIPGSFPIEPRQYKYIKITVHTAFCCNTKQQQLSFIQSVIEVMSTNTINSINHELTTRNAYNYKSLQNNICIRTMSAIIIVPKIINSYNCYNTISIILMKISLNGLFKLKILKLNNFLLLPKIKIKTQIWSFIKKIIHNLWLIFWHYFLLPHTVSSTIITDTYKIHPTNLYSILYFRINLYTHL